MRPPTRGPDRSPFIRDGAQAPETHDQDHRLSACILAACVEQGTTRSEPIGMRESSSNAESACMNELNRQYGGGVARIDELTRPFSPWMPDFKT
jgi:hypothetical protein